MEKNFIDEFIPSKDTRAYLHSINHVYCKKRDRKSGEQISSKT